MSIWHEAKEKDIELDGDEVNIYAGWDADGNRYVTIKLDKLKEILEKLTDK